MEKFLITNGTTFVKLEEQYGEPILTRNHKLAETGNKKYMKGLLDYFQSIGDNENYELANIEKYEDTNVNSF